MVGIGEVPLPEPGPGEVRLQVAAAALNHLDVWVRRGLPIQTTMPHVGGADVAGVVDALGTGVTAVRIDDRVVVNPSLWCGACEWCARGQHPLCLTYRILGEHVQGGFAEFVVVPARNLYPVPAGYPMETAAAAPLAFLTAWRALAKRARLTAGESVLITGASGGVATAAIRIARHLGARVYAVTSGDNVERVRTLGADVVYDRDEVDFGKGVWRDTGRRGVDVVLDSVGQATWPRVVRSAARGGRIVVYGATTGPALETDGRVLFWKQLDVLGTTMSTHAEFEEVMELVFSGALEPVIDVVWPLDRARDAHERLEAGAQFGKIVLVP
ncbi:MAG: alcohol dehydrogenase catalytic domain-containing protein [Gemmatimonadota bacterium]